MLNLGLCIGPNAKKCSGKKFWKVRRGKLRCKNCGYEFVPRIGLINLTRYQWKALLKWFLRCQSINVVTEETRISKYKILKALNLVRGVMVLDIPEVFSGTVEVDETYLGGQWKYKRKSVKKNQKLSKRGLGTTRQPVFGILTRQGKAWAIMVDDTEAKNLIPIIEKRITKGSKFAQTPGELTPDLQQEGMFIEQLSMASRNTPGEKPHKWAGRVLWLP